MGSFQISEVLGQGTFRLADLHGNTFDKPVNGFRLKPFFVENPIQNKQLVGVGLVEAVCKEFQGV